MFISSTEFVETLRGLPLLSTEQQAQMPTLAQQFSDLKDLGKELITRGWLTSFQANQLAKGKGRELVLDQYLLLDLLGRGGMGAVFKASQMRMKRLVALKIIRPEMLNAPTAVERFKREAEAAARLAHPNIVTVHDTNEANGVHFLVMEYIEGIDLAQLVKQNGPLPVAQACDFIRQAALGLQHAHEQGLVHRDIKPANLMLTRQGIVKVMDMGLARTAQSARETTASRDLTGTGVMMGTADYLSPEQAEDARSVDIRADIYSLGCTLYHLLAGEPPFEGGTLPSKIAAHMFKEPEALDTRRAAVPAALAAVVRRMMAKKPEDRYQTPGDVAAALAPFVATSEGHPLAPALPVWAMPTALPIEVEVPPLAQPVTGVTASLPVSGPAPSATTQEALPRTSVWAAATLAVVENEAKPPRPRRRWVAVSAVVAGLGIFLGSLLFALGLHKDGAATSVAAGRKSDVRPSPGTRPTEPPKLPGKEFTNTLGMKMLPIPAGKFMMGSTREEIERCLKLVGDKGKEQILAEGPEHEVEITRPFYMSATNVTLGQFRKFVNEMKYVVIPPIPLTEISPFPQLVFGQQGDQRVVEAERRRKAWESYPDDHPVTHVSWQNARDFCTWLSEKDGKTYRLPKEAEWEYCCRAGRDGLRYCFGNEERDLASFAWFGANSGKKTHPVNELEPNAWGLYDMHGNARTWCQDSYDPNYYKSSPKINPPGGAGNDRVHRGGSFNDGPVGCRAAFRSRMDPSTRADDVGFRVVLVP